ncbi:MAG: hypothetical protein V2J24_21525 [Pseudomonadales bacterium]|jgi:hypothetical protein|nr:hypothetical protein [Pseudomonadales bacterium]
MLATNSAMASVASATGPRPTSRPAMYTAQPVMGTITLTGAEVESAM